MNVVPWFLRGFARWDAIKREVDAYARGKGWPTYSEKPKQYRFWGWGTVGFPPRVACNVIYFDEADNSIEIPRRFTGKGFEDSSTARVYFQEFD